MRYAILALFLVGCGSSAPENPLANTAWVMIDQATNCAVGVDFKGEAAYRWAMVCTLVDNSQAAYVEDGHYAVAGDNLSMTADAASCPSNVVTRDFAATFSVTPGHLTLFGPGGALAFDSIVPGGGNGAITFGCFDSDTMTFTAYPLTPL